MTPARTLSPLTLAIVVVVSLLADRLTKWWAVAALTDGPMFVHPWLSFQLVMNRGVAFGMFQGSATVVGWITLFIVLGMLLFLRQLPPYEWLTRLGLSLMIGGAIGNMVDRIAAGEVVDFIATPLRAGIFNLADVAVNVGMVLVIAGTWWHGRSHQQAAPETAVDDPPTLP